MVNNFEKEPIYIIAFLYNMTIKDIHKQKINNKPKVLVILGTTSAGKTSLGVKLAAEFKGEIISADSRQVYKGMDIGTGKDLKEYKLNGKKIKYHLIDVASPKQQFDVSKYQELAFKAIRDILRRNKLPIIVGGTGLYLQAVVDNLKLSSVKPDLKKRALLEKLSAPELFERLSKLKPEFAVRLNNSDKHNKRRLIRYIEVVGSDGFEKTGRQDSIYDFLVLGLDFSDEIIKGKIIKRINDRLDSEDMVKEVENLHKNGLSWERLESFGLEYKFISQYLQEKFDYETMVDKLSTASYRFAKRQKTWFRRFEKQGGKINWIHNQLEAERIIKTWL